MLEGIVLLAFVAALAVCVFAGKSVLWALAGGYLIFCAYGLFKRHSLAELGKMSLSGVKTVRNILMIFGLIGFITALWRMSGTIAVIVCWSSRLVSPSAFLLIAFLLNCMVSILTGTSFGTGATMGVICMAMGRAMELDPFWIGGAVLSGIYFGDRCSPVSSSANLVCILTKTDIYENIRGMVKTSIVPFIVTCIFYYTVGKCMTAGNGRMDVEGLFSNSFVLHWSAVIPAVIILLLSAFRVEVKKTMLISIVIAVFLSVILQGKSFEEVFRMCITGYKAKDPAISSMMNGGGLKSMINVAAIVSLSSCYAGIFEGTGLLKPIQGKIEILSKKITSFGATLVVSIAASMIACNQTLAIMLTDQLCKAENPDNKKFAIDLENTAAVLAPLVPWSIAGAVPLAALGAPTSSMLVASYLYILPIWSFVVNSHAALRQYHHE